jgi:Ca2+-binding RTX toxin-like protein
MRRLSASYLARFAFISSFSFILALGALFVSAPHAEAAVTATIVAGTLQVTGDNLGNTITIRVVAGDPTRLEVLELTTVIGTFPRAGLTGILVDSLAGEDGIYINRINGEITERAVLYGGDGNDGIRGGAGNDEIYGGPGDDRLEWHPGDGNDLLDGNDGADTLEMYGTDAPENFAVTANGARVAITRDIGNVLLDLAMIERLTLSANGGNDSTSCTGNLAALIYITIDGGQGDDTLNGSNGADVIFGGAGNDTIRTNQGNDTVFADLGDDLMLWFPGDGSDTIEGQQGVDKLQFNGSAINETFDIAPNGARLRLLRNVGTVAMDLNGVEVVEVLAMGGPDTFNTAASLAGTSVTSLILDGGDADDTINGSDTNDILRGGAGVDTIDGRAGNDTIVPGPGDEPVVLGGEGNDTMIWNDGDGNDGFGGQGGIDTLEFNGSAVDEEILVVLARSVRSPIPFVRVARNVGPSRVDVDGTEKVKVSTLGGTDIVTVGAELTGLADVNVDLGPGADTLNTSASSTVNANGNTEFDTFTFDAENKIVSTTPSTIAVGGVTRLTHVNFEQRNSTKLMNAPPTISMTSPTTEPVMTVKTPFITLAGTAADETGIVSVAWVNNRGGGGATTGTTSWTVSDVPLFAGVNVITVTVTDSSGNQASDILTVTTDVLSYTMAEGATGPFFDTDILIANPNSVVAPITVTYLKGDGTTMTQNLDLPAMSRTTIAVDGIAGLENTEVSSTVTSNQALPLVVERTMRWDATGYGAHTERATDAPAKTWYFAEGSQGFFQTFVLLANPGSVSNEATITFLLENGAPVVKRYTLAPTSRQTIDIASIPELANQGFGIVVSFTEPGVAERAMYFGTPLFNAGHESAGVNAPATEWFLAEGATGSFFTTFVLLANPGATDATVSLTFLPTTGLPVTRTHVVQAGRRLTLNIAAEDASLATGAVATQVTSTQPILVERAQYWPSSPDRWYEAHNSFGGTSLAKRWGLAEGRVGGPESYQTYILLANADAAQSSEVTITFLRTDGTTVSKNVSVTPTSRFNVHVNSMVPELANESFGAVIQVTSGAGIFVERAMYSDARGVTFAAGTNALATRLP